MADINDIQSALTTKIVGSDATGVEQTPVQSTSAGGLHINLRNASGTELLGTQKRVNSIPVTTSEEATFSVYINATAIASNKSMISIFNTNGAPQTKVRLRELRIINAQTTAVTGIIADLALRRITGHSVGTALTPNAEDTSDVLSTNVTVRTGATVAGEVASDLRRWKFSSDEWGPGNLDVEGLDQAIQKGINLLPFNQFTKPLTLNANEGFTLKQLTNSAAGSFNILLIFTVEFP